MERKLLKPRYACVQEATVWLYYFPLSVKIPMNEQQNNSRLIGRARLKSNQCCKGHCKRKNLLNHGDHDVMEGLRSLFVENNEKLGDDHINAASQLLCTQFEELQDLSYQLLINTVMKEHYGYRKYRLPHVLEHVKHPTGT